MNTILLELIHDDDHAVLINVLQIETVIFTGPKGEGERVIRIIFASGKTMELRDTTVGKKNYYINITRLYNAKLIP